MLGLMGGQVGGEIDGAWMWPTVSTYISKFHMKHMWKEKGEGPRASTVPCLGPRNTEAGKSMDPS